MLHQTNSEHNYDLANATETGAGWGKADATDGADQRGSAYFPIGSPAWRAYNDGYASGAEQRAALTGEEAHYWNPSDPYVIQKAGRK